MRIYSTDEILDTAFLKFTAIFNKKSSLTQQTFKTDL